MYYKHDRKFRFLICVTSITMAKYTKYLNSITCLFQPRDKQLFSVINRKVTNYMYIKL